MTQETLTAFLGWMAVLNIAFLTLATLLILAMKGWAARLHGRLFGLEPADVHLAMYDWLGRYKLATLILSVMPYLAVRLV